MKKSLILTLLLGCATLWAAAENALYVSPQSIKKGSTSDDARSFAVCLDNDAVFTAVQFDIHLPEGVDFDTEYDPIEPVDDRFPYTEDRKHNKIYKHNINYAYHTEGFYRVQITSQELATFKGNSGEFITIYYVSDANVATGTLPVLIDNVTMAISGTEGIYPSPSPSFFWAGDFDPATTAVLDLSKMEGSMCEGVTVDLATLIGGNKALAELRLDGLDDVAGDIDAANPNCLKFAKAGSEVATRLSGNVVTVSETDCTSDAVALVDGQPFSCGTEVACTSITYTRDFATTDWQALFLPFAVPADQWKAAGTVAKLVSADDEGASAALRWEMLTTEDLLPNTPYIIKPEDTGAIEFVAQGASLSPFDQENSKQEVKSATRTFTLCGIYATKSDMFSTGAYALADGNFKHASSETVTLRPFRIYLEVSGASKPAKVRNIVDAGTTAIDDIVTDEVATPAYDLLGRKASANTTGVIISNGKKTIK